MNFKTLLFIFTFLIFITGCGVKGPPIPPPDNSLPPIIDKYIEKQDEKKDKDDE